MPPGRPPANEAERTFGERAYAGAEAKRMDDQIFITGAARGLGLAMTRDLLSRGCRFSVLVRSESDGLGELRARFGEQLGGPPGRRDR